MRKIVVILQIGFLFSLLSVSLAQAETTAILGLYNEKNDQQSNELVIKLEQLGTNTGCALRRHGRVNKIKGNYKLNATNAFFLYVCEIDHSVQVISQSLLVMLKSTVENVALLEGPISQFGSFGLATSTGDRSYIIKLSDYNNLSPMKRNLDLQALGKQNDKLKYNYKIEAFIRIHEATGMQRPDEIVVIYYDSQAEAEKFRSQNEKFMKRIGRFNIEHLSQFSYLFISSS